MKLEAAIQAVENAITFLESLGYTKGGDIHDDLGDALEYLRLRKLALAKAQQIGADYSARAGLAE